MRARYVHTNLVARDWRKLVAFYCDVFGCVPKPPARDLAGDWIDRLTGLNHARLAGMHLLLPGFERDGPTLEIFSYETMIGRVLPAPNEPGYGHIAFAVDDVEAALGAVEAAGGSAVGEVVRAEIPGAGALCVVYARDPEGNVLELQKWT